MMANSWRVFWKYLAKVFHDTQSSETYLAKKSFDDLPILSIMLVKTWRIISKYLAKISFDGKLVQKHPDKFQRQPNFGKIWFNFA